jgi:seryl-tRNA synthetase
MHDIRWIRDNPAEFDRRLMRRKPDFKGTADQLMRLDELRRARVRVLEGWQATRRSASEGIRQAMAEKNDALVAELKQKVNDAKESIPVLEKEVKESEAEIKALLESLPNLPLDEVPEGEDEHGNVEHHKFGAKRDYAFTPKQHFELGEALGMMDFELAAKLSGARFVVLTGGLARLERALGQFMLDLHTQEHGYTEVNPPILVRDDAMFGTAQLPKFQTDQYFASSEIDWTEIDSILDARGSYSLMQMPINPPNIQHVMEGLAKITNEQREAYAQENEGGSLDIRTFIDRTKSRGLTGRHWLIPTAEVPLTNLVREDITDEARLPMRLTACTPCFRAEAGAAGRDTRGMIRQHQFTKVELVSITTPEQAMDEHERMTASAEEVLRRLGLHYRVVTLCTGDMGFASQKTYDIEVWLPGQNAYREISSCSVCGDFQARRMNARFRGKDNKLQFVHTLNGSGVAVGRALIAVMETWQQADGSIMVPDALAPYMGGMKVIEKK